MNSLEVVEELINDDDYFALLCYLNNAVNTILRGPDVVCLLWVYLLVILVVKVVGWAKLNNNTDDWLWEMRW